MVKKLVLLGSPVALSISPAIQNAAFAAAGLDWSYEAMEVAPDELASTIAGLRTKEWIGANITIPFKETVLSLLDEIAPSAAQTLAVNTIINREGHLLGHNTDLQGFMRDLRANWQIPRNGRSLILGAGGSARAVAFGLAQEGFDLHLIARTTSRAESLARDVRRNYGVQVAIFPWSNESFTKAARECNLIVNATPIGMASNDHHSPWPGEASFPPDAFVYDLVYLPKDTRLVKRARQAGLMAVSGAGMLLEQAELSYELWTDLPAPRKQMRAALEGALEHAHGRERTEVQPNHREVLDA